MPAYDDAVAKLRREMEQGKDDQYIQVIGVMLLKQLEADPGAADMIMDDKKSIVKSIDAMATAAKKKKKNGRAMFSDAEGFEIVLKYYGIKGKAAVLGAGADYAIGGDMGSAPDAVAVTKFASAPSAPAAPARAVFEIDLDDLLG